MDLTQVELLEELQELLHIREQVAQAIGGLSAYEAANIAAQLAHTRVMSEVQSSIAEKLEALIETLREGAALELRKGAA
jgi:hypothetical protein